MIFSNIFIASDKPLDKIDLEIDEIDLEVCICVCTFQKNDDFKMSSLYLTLVINAQIYGK